MKFQDSPESRASTGVLRTHPQNERLHGTVNVLPSPWCYGTTSGTTHIKTLSYRERDATRQRKLVAENARGGGSHYLWEGCCQSSLEEGFLKQEEKAASGSSWDWRY